MIDQLRHQVRQRAVACLLGDSQYAVGAAMCRKMGWPEDVVFDAVTQASDVTGDDDYLAFEDAFGYDNSLLDTLSDREA